VDICAHSRLLRRRRACKLLEVSLAGKSPFPDIGLVAKVIERKGAVHARKRRVHHKGTARRHVVAAHIRRGIPVFVRRSQPPIISLTSARQSRSRCSRTICSRSGDQGIPSVPLSANLGGCSEHGGRPCVSDVNGRLRGRGVSAAEGASRCRSTQRSPRPVEAAHIERIVYLGATSRAMTRRGAGMWIVSVLGEPGLVKGPKRRTRCQ